MAEPWVIDDDGDGDFADPQAIGMTTGLIPRDYAAHPTGYCAAAPAFPTNLLIRDKHAQQEYLDAQVEAKSSLKYTREDYYDLLKSLNQNGLGLCWNFSGTKSNMYKQAKQNNNAKRMSGWWGAGIINGWRDRGGWGVKGIELQASQGCPEESFCPSYKSQHNTAECQANAALHKITEWWDGTDDRQTNMLIMIWAFLVGHVAPVLDFNHIAHSMCGCYLESLDPLTIWCDNSWGESSGVKGMYKLVGNKAIPDGIVVPRTTLAA